MRSALFLGDYNPYCYTFVFSQKALPNLRIVMPSITEWAFTIIRNRNRGARYCKFDIPKTHADGCEGADIIVTPIVDDWMRYSLRAFADNTLTDEGLVACYERIPYGTQVVCVTDKACAALQFVEEQLVTLEEVGELDRYYWMRLREAEETVARIQEEFTGIGKLITELL